MARKHIVLILAIVGTALTASLWALEAYDRSPAVLRQRLTRLLNLDHAPNSLHAITCQDWGTTDLLVNCYAALDPADFPQLLTGYLRDRPALPVGQQTSHDQAITTGPIVGPAFPVAQAYHVDPKPGMRNGYRSFSYGGHIALYTDATHTQILLTFYEE